MCSTIQTEDSSVFKGYSIYGRAPYPSLIIRASSVFSSLNEPAFSRLRNVPKTGALISQPQVVGMETNKVKAVVEWPEPRTIKEMQRFLRFTNFYHRFITGFSTVAALLTNLLKGKKTKCLNFNQEARDAFRKLKALFTSVPVLKLPDPTRPFLVEVDALEVGIGSVLSQHQGSPEKLYPCTFFSCKVTPAERKYDIGNRELLAVKAALEEWCPWLEEHNILLLC